jgi:hypothetical protein
LRNYFKYFIRSFIMEENAKHISVHNEKEWAEALEEMSNAEGGTIEAPKVWKVEIAGNVDAEGNLRVKASPDSTIKGAGKKVLLTGSGTISLRTDGSILWVAAGQTFIIDGRALTLKGKSANDAAAVYIDGGKVELKCGTIRGNENNKGGDVVVGDGGGVYVGGGTFTMSGGEISGNYADAHGGGVCIGGGTFEMSNGKIIDNGTMIGSGVFVQAGTFVMSGKAIIGGNKAVQGGGVFVQGGEFTMEGGKIYGNRAECGGGVFVHGGKCTMEGGTVYGKYELDEGGVVVKNTASKCGAALYRSGGTVNLDMDITDCTIQNGKIVPPS